MAVISLRRNAKTFAIFLGAGLLLTFLYSKAMENAPKHFIHSRGRNNFEVSLGTFEPEPEVLTRRRQPVFEGDCRFIEPWFNQSSFLYKNKIQMIFFAKPIMQSLRAISIEKHWEMALIPNDSHAGLLKLHKFISKPLFTIVITSSRLYKHFALQNLSFSKNALVSAVRFSYTVAGGKKGQITTYREHFSEHGCSLDSLQIMPKSFLLDNVTDCLRFFKFANQNLNSWWVLKESSGYGGSGVTIHTNMSELYQRFSLCQSKEEYVVQQYVPNVLLVQGRKFDVRGLVLIASTNPYLLFHHNGYLRVSMEQFTKDGGKAAHITNSHLQSKSNHFSPQEHIWTFDRFQGYLDAYYPDNNNFVEDVLVPFIKKTALFILQTGRSKFTRAPSSYQLLGLDFMVSSDYKVWFIEANNYPLWPVGSKPVDNLMRKMGNDMFDLLFEVRENPLKFSSMEPGTRYKSWELVWNELDEKCSSDYFYNPCSLFKPASDIL